MLKASGHTQKNKIIFTLSVILAISSVVSLWANGYIEIYFNSPDMQVWYSVLLIISALFAFVGFIMSIVATRNTTSWHKFISVVCIFATFIAFGLELISVLFQNSLT